MRTPEKGSSSIIERKRDGKKVKLKRTTIYLPVDLARRLAIFCATNTVQMSSLITELLEKKLRGS